MSVSPTNSLLNPRRADAFRPPGLGDLLNAIVPAIESIGLDVDRVCDDGFLVRIAGHTILGEFRTRTLGVVPRAGNGDEPDPDDASWDDDTRWVTSDEPDDTFPDRRSTRTADTELTPEEREQKEQLAPFSRNELDPDTCRRISHALESYELLRRIL